uniref:Putative merlin/moesin/ezrin/radixin n=1 Tax=Schistosoma mansoni TaxID=6183 RepID=A0A5K4EXI7_SCHMA
MKWNNSDAKCLKIRVTLHESELEFNISPKSTGKYLFDLVCSTIGLRETWYFGLQFYSFFPNGRMQLSHWLKLDKKIVSQKPEDISKSLCFFFHTKFFPEDVEQELIQATTRRLFYLSVKSTILNRSESNMNGNCFGDLCPSLDVAILLASLASQAEYGDLCEEELSDTEELTFLPRRILRLIPAQLWTQIHSTQGVTQKFREHYKSHKGMNRDKAELQYLKVAQMHNLFGVDFFPIVYVRMKFPRTLSLAQNESTIWDNTNQCHTNAWLGVTAAGLQLYGKCQRDPPQFTFPWNMIKNVSYRERKFTIKLTSTCRATSKPSQITSIPTLLNETRGPVVISSKASQPSRSPLISITGQAFVGVAVGSSAGGSGTSAASLPSTPISARLVPAVPPVSPNLLDASVNLSSPRAVSKFESCDTAQQLGAPKGFKGRAKVLELGSRCIPGLSIKSSCYSANEFAVTRTSVNCLRAPRVQSAENNVSLPSKGLLKSSNLNFETVSISVVEVWLADPNQAKTVMSMCAGNHSLFMRRRQPDSIEVQQMRAQAREERARREVERARLAKARAEKAEALEAKSVLEARCAQLEEALIHQQKCQNPYTSDNHNRLFDTYAVNSPSTQASQCISNPYNCKVAFSPMKKENQKDVKIDSIPMSQTLNDDDDDQKSISNPTEDNDKTTSDIMNGDRCGNYFDDYSFYPPVTSSDRYPAHHGKSWDDGIHTDQNNLVYNDPLYPNISVNSFPVFSEFTDHRFAPGSVSVPVTPHVKRTEMILDRRTNCYPQSSFWPFESTSCPVDLHSERAVYKTQSNKKVVLYPSYLVTNLGPVYPDGSFCGIALKSLSSGNHCLTGEIPIVSVEESISKEPETSFTPFVIVPGSLPALHNDEVFNSKSRIGPTGVSHSDHNPCACAVMSTGHQPPTICHIRSPPQTIIREVSYTVPTSVLRHSQYYTPSCHVQFVPHDPADHSQYMYSSPSLAAILSPIVNQRLHRRMPIRPQPCRGLKRQQSQPKSTRSSDSVHIPLMERSTSYMQMPYSENDCGLASTDDYNLTNNHFLPHPTNRGCSFQYTPCSINVHSKYYDFQSGLRYPNEVYPNPLYYPFHSPTTNEYLHRAASLDVSSGNNDLLWNKAPHELLSRTGKCNEDENAYLLESNPPYSQRSFLTNELQEERAHFAFLQTQFSRQLCDTWGYLKAARGQQVDKLCDLATHGIGSNIYK